MKPNINLLGFQLVGQISWSKPVLLGLKGVEKRLWKPDAHLNFPPFFLSLSQSLNFRIPCGFLISNHDSWEAKKRKKKVFLICVYFFESRVGEKTSHQIFLWKKEINYPFVVNHLWKRNSSKLKWIPITNTKHFFFLDDAASFCQLHLNGLGFIFNRV